MKAGVPPIDPYKPWWKVVGASLAVALSLVPLWQLSDSRIGSLAIVAGTASLLVVVTRTVEWWRAHHTERSND